MSWTAEIIAIDKDNHRFIVLYTDGEVKITEPIGFVANWQDIIRNRATTLNGQSETIKDLVIGPVDLTPPNTVVQKEDTDKLAFFAASRNRALLAQTFGPDDQLVIDATELVKSLYKPEYFN